MYMYMYIYIYIYIITKYVRDELYILNNIKYTNLYIKYKIILLLYYYTI